MLRSNLGHHLALLSSPAKLAVMVGIDAIFLPLCMLASVALRLGSLEAAVQAAPVTQFLIGCATLPVLGFAGLYRTVVRYIDLRVVAAASLALAAAVLVTFGLTVVFNVLSLPRSALLVYWFVAFAYVVTSRFVARAVLRQGLRHARRPRVRTAIYGAGAAGAQLAQTMQFSVEYKAVCFLDDDPELQGKTVAALKVYPPDALQDAVYRHDVEQIVVAIPSAGVAQKRMLIARVESAGLPVKILPSLAQLVDGAANLSDIRDLDVADLLGRDPVPPQAQLFARNIVGKVVLVTGAGGSIGSELCRQIVSQRPQRLVLLDHSEFSLYALEQELRTRLHGVELHAHLGSVVDEALLARLLRDHAVQTVYHAAAYKHVPMLEDNVQQGVRNNVFGTLAVVRSVVAAAVETCVLVSTDKAVRPTNVMGATKRAAELIFQAAAQRGGPTRFSMVRFGNVLGSSGSVVPLFKQQIHAGGPITITHPDIIRYFMLIPEAAQLVIQAGAMARGGEVFVLDMGEPVRIVELARSMIRLAGLTEKTADLPDGDIEIRYVGLRPGEKLFEELLIGNDAVPSGHPRILSAHERHIDPALLDKMLESLRTASDTNEHEAMLRRLRNLVPEFRPPDEVNRRAALALSVR
ncbi:MAG: nucleoside-diphosphate sugar epimerase/dehydratase [Burkholderiaceae bacterium]